MMATGEYVRKYGGALLSRLTHVRLGTQRTRPDAEKKKRRAYYLGRGSVSRTHTTPSQWRSRFDAVDLAGDGRECGRTRRSYFEGRASMVFDVLANFAE